MENKFTSNGKKHNNKFHHFSLLTCVIHLQWYKRTVTHIRLVMCQHNENIKEIALYLKCERYTINAISKRRPHFMISTHVTLIQHLKYHQSWVHCLAGIHLTLLSQALTQYPAEAGSSEQENVKDDYHYNNCRLREKPGWVKSNGDSEKLVARKDNFFFPL